jgi:hypothetical protein
MLCEEPEEWITILVYAGVDVERMSLVDPPKYGERWTLL